MKELTKVKIKIHMLNAASVGLNALAWGIKLLSNAGTAILLIAAFGLIAAGTLFVSIMFGISHWILIATAFVIGLIITIKQERERKVGKE